jgi:centromere protein S
MYRCPHFDTRLLSPPTLYVHVVSLTLSYPANTSRDLEVFSKHGGRKAINTDDVMLLTRRNDALETMLRTELEGMRAAEGRVEARVGGAAEMQGKKRGRPAGKGKGKA